MTWVDAFADAPFAGNPAVVCVAERPCDERWMQAVAREIGLSETAFVEPRGEEFGLRWFTPTVEVDLCGHATLASAHVLWEEERLPSERPARFRTRSGLITARRLDDGWIALDFPATPAEAGEAPEGLAEGLGARPLWAGRTSQGDWVVELGDEAAVRALAPDMRRLAGIEMRGVIVTAAADMDGADYVLRFFGPGSGVDEDPVTGSAQCALAPFWSERLGRSALVAFQASPRGGWLRVRADGERVGIEGRAITVLRGELAI
ncbi:MAG TPA: PhzF family phenazine biosynthesis protein [Gemmatimonadota bacterium]|nr:PhzF family phenazine biosynthesis protein [Gemmatimonadota bacterium]